jgi:PKD repeat protein
VLNPTFHYFEKFLKLVEQVFAGTENLSQNWKHPQQESWNGDDGSNLVSTPEDDVQNPQHLFEVLIITTESLTAGDGPEDVNDRNVEHSFVVDDSGRIGRSSFLNFVQHFTNFVRNHVFDGCRTETQITQMAQRESSLLLPEVTVSELDSFKCEITFNGAPTLKIIC